MDGTSLYQFISLRPLTHFRVSSQSSRFPALLLLLIFWSLVSILPSGAESLREARVVKAINRVHYYSDIDRQSRPRLAQPGKTIIRRNEALRTGRDSRSELRFNDGSILRLGARSLFSFGDRSRTINLARGTLLMQVEKNSSRTRIRTEGVTGTITGTTIVIEHAPGEHVKMIVLEGSMDVELQDRWGASRSLAAGEMILVASGSSRLPEPVRIDVERFKKTAGLITDYEQDEALSREVDSRSSDEESNVKQIQPHPGTGGVKPFSLRRINQTIAEQTHQKQQGELVSTKRVIKGRGKRVRVLSGEHHRGPSPNARGRYSEHSDPNGPSHTRTAQEGRPRVSASQLSPSNRSSNQPPASSSEAPSRDRYRNPGVESTKPPGNPAKSSTKKYPPKTTPSPSRGTAWEQGPSGSPPGVPGGSSREDSRVKPDPASPHASKQSPGIPSGSRATEALESRGPDQRSSESGPGHWSSVPESGNSKATQIRAEHGPPFPFRYRSLKDYKPKVKGESKGNPKTGNRGARKARN